MMYETMAGTLPARAPPGPASVQRYCMSKVLDCPIHPGVNMSSCEMRDVPPVLAMLSMVPKWKRHSLNAFVAVPPLELLEEDDEDDALLDDDDAPELLEDGALEPLEDDAPAPFEDAPAPLFEDAPPDPAVPAAPCESPSLPQPPAPAAAPVMRKVPRDHRQSRERRETSMVRSSGGRAKRLKTRCFGVSLQLCRCG